MLRGSSATLFFLVLLFSFGLSPALAEWSISSISERYAPAVVEIAALDETGRKVGSGSGFFVNSRGDIATSYHVLENASKAVVRTVKGEEGEVVGITHADPGVDLLVARTSFRHTFPVTLGDSQSLTAGESVLVMGNSPGWEGTLSSGTIAHIRKAGDLTLIQITARILPGGSGGPVFNISGEVIGVATAFEDFAHFAMPIQYLKSLKPEPSSVEALRGGSLKLEASLVNEELVDVTVRPGLPAPALSTLSAAGDHRPLTVYFKSGKEVHCDWIWKEGETLFLVHRGKGFAVGYDLDLIDEKRSLLR